MKKVTLGVNNDVPLDSTFVNRQEFTVTVTIVGEDGKVVLAADNTTQLQNVACVWDADLNKYKAGAINFSPSVSPQYLRFYWTVLKGGIAQQLADEYAPEEIKAVPSVTPSSEMVVPVGYFIDYTLAAASKMDKAYADAIAAYPRDGIRQMLLSAQGNLENRIKMNFFATAQIEAGDYYFDNRFGDSFWLHQCFHRPIISVTSFKMFHGTQLVIDIPAADIVFEPKEGMLRYVPNRATGGLLFQQLMASAEGITLAVIGRSGANLIPNGFHVEYVSGLDFPSQPPQKKASFQQAVARNALIELLPIIDPAMRTASESESIDGASFSSSKQVQAIIKELRASETEWVKDIEKEYGVGFDMVIV